MNLLADYLPFLEVLRLKTNLILPTEIEMIFDVFLQGEGWYAPEADANTWFRWIGEDGRGVLRIVIDRRRPIRIKLDVFSVIDVEVLRNITILYREKVIIPQVAAQHGSYSLGFVLPADLIESSQVTEISVISPINQSAGDDHRRLSVAFSSLRASAVEEGETPGQFSDTIEMDRLVLRNLNSLGKLLGVSANTEASSFGLTLSPLYFAQCGGTSGGYAFSVRKQVIQYGPFYGEVSYNVGGSSYEQITFSFVNGLSQGSIRQLLFPRLNGVDETQDRHVTFRRTSACADFSIDRDFDLSYVTRGFLNAFLYTFQRQVLESDDVSLCGSDGMISGHLLRTGLRSSFVIQFGARFDHDCYGFGEIEVLDGLTGRWTVSKKAVLRLPFPVSGALKISITGGRVFESCLGSFAIISLGDFACEVAVTEPLLLEAFLCCDQLIREISIFIPAAKSPKELLLNDDCRPLGFFIKEVTIEAFPRLVKWKRSPV